MITEFGKQLRKYRIDRVVTLRSMADSMGISPAYLSAIETGKRNISTQIFNSIVNFFELSAEKETHLQKLADISQKEISMSIENMRVPHRDLAASFARRLNTLTDEELEKINAVLRGE